MKGQLHIKAVPQTPTWRQRKTKPPDINLMTEVRLFVVLCLITSVDRFTCYIMYVFGECLRASAALQCYIMYRAK